jgi:hypothetical protein
VNLPVPFDKLTAVFEPTTYTSITKVVISKIEID